MYKNKYDLISPTKWEDSVWYILKVYSLNFLEWNLTPKKVKVLPLSKKNEKFALLRRMADFHFFFLELDSFKKRLFFLQWILF